MSFAIPRRARRALLAAAVPAALAATALPAGADAASVRVTGGQLQYTAAAGETNDTRVAFTGTHIHIRDNVPITVGDGCVIDDTDAAICVAGSAQARYSLGNGSDVMRYHAPHAAQVDMGADDDTYFGGAPRGLDRQSTAWSCRTPTSSAAPATTSSPTASRRRAPLARQPVQ